MRRHILSRANVVASGGYAFCAMYASMLAKPLARAERYSVYDIWARMWDLYKYLHAITPCNDPILMKKWPI